MERADRRVDPVHLYLGVVTVLAGTSILLMYLLFRVAAPDVFNALVQSPWEAVGNNPGSVALLVVTLLVIGLLVVAVVALGTRAAEGTPAERKHPPRK
jgi:choline-glycine betaine transporter